jgi:hypothetical protein
MLPKVNVTLLSNEVEVEAYFTAPDTALPDGCLVKNCGVPIIVVACNAQVMSELESQRTMKDEQIDGIQQILRTLCLKCKVYIREC